MTHELRVKFFRVGVFLVLMAGLAVGISARGGIANQAQVTVVDVGGASASTVSAFDAPMLEDELPAGLNIDAKVAFIREIEGPDTILSYHTKIFWPIASITKLMTGVIVEETLGEDIKIQITESALETEGVAGNLKKGQKYTAWDLMKAMFTVSSNDAAEALAQEYEKTQLTPAEFNSALSKHANFVEKMNEKALELGMTETSFGDTTGLAMTNQSTAGDLYKLVVYISKHYPDFWKITRNKTNTITDLISGKRQTLTSINTFSGTADFIGGKTGHTDESGDNLISIFTYNGRQYVLLVFGAQDRFMETTKLFNWLRATINN